MCLLRLVGSEVVIFEADFVILGILICWVNHTTRIFIKIELPSEI